MQNSKLWNIPFEWTEEKKTKTKKKQQILREHRKKKLKKMNEVFSFCQPIEEKRSLDCHNFIIPDYCCILAHLTRFEKINALHIWLYWCRFNWMHLMFSCTVYSINEWMNDMIFILFCKIFTDSFLFKFLFCCVCHKLHLCSQFAKLTHKQTKIE